MWQCQAHEMPYRPRDYISIAVQPTGCLRLCADDLRNITRNRRFLSDDNYGQGLVPCGATKKRFGYVLSVELIVSTRVAQFCTRSARRHSGLSSNRITHGQDEEERVREKNLMSIAGYP